MKLIRCLTVWLLVLSFLPAMAGCQGTPAPTTVPEITSRPTLPPETTVPTEPEEPESLILARSILEATDGKSVGKVDATYRIDCSMTMTMAGFSMEAEYATLVNCSTAIAREPYASHTQMSTKTTVGGQDIEQEAEIYTVAENDTLASYTYDTSLDAWTRENLDITTQEAIDSIPSLAFLTGLEPDAMTVGETSVEPGTEPSRLLSCSLNGEQLVQLLDHFGENYSLTALGISRADLNTATAEAQIWVNANTFSPLRLIVTVYGLEELLNGELADAMGSLSSPDMGLDATMTITNFQVSLDNISYGPAEVPVLPDRAVSFVLQSAFDPDMGDGTYVIRESGSGVRITCPKYWTVFSTGYYHTVEFMRMDYSQLFTFQMLTGKTEDDIRDLIQNTYAPEQMGEDTELTFKDGKKVRGFETMQVNSEYRQMLFAWKQYGESYLLVTLVDYSGEDLYDAAKDMLKNVEEYDVSQDTFAP